MKDASQVQSHPVPEEFRIFLKPVAEFFEKDTAAPSTPEGTRWRGSQAGQCGRKVAYETLGEPRTDPPTPADLWRMGLGTMVHAQLEPAIQHWLDTDESLVIDEEVSIKLGLHGYGHADMLLTTNDSDHKVLCELKTINGTGYKQAIGGAGPRHSALLQGALYAEALEADLLVICYLATELLGPGWADSRGFDNTTRFGAEWHYTREEFLPMAQAERLRLESITSMVHDRQDPSAAARAFAHSDPDIPANAEIVDPRTGLWREFSHTDVVLSQGKTWQCNYCSHQQRCIQDHDEGN